MKFRHLKLSENSLKKLDEAIEFVATRTGEDNVDLAIEIPEVRGSRATS